MRIVITAIIVLIIGGGLTWLLISRSDEQGQAITYATVQDNIQNKGAHLYDVRTAAEYSTSHFAGATNWPVETMQAGELPSVAKDTQLYVYCRSGNRSSQATALLKQAGFTKVTDLGGLSDVEAIGGDLQ